MNIDEQYDKNFLSFLVNSNEKMVRNPLRKNIDEASEKKDFFKLKNLLKEAVQRVDEGKENPTSDETRSYEHFYYANVGVDTQNDDNDEFYQDDDRGETSRVEDLLIFSPEQIVVITSSEDLYSSSERETLQMFVLEYNGKNWHTKVDKERNPISHTDIFDEMNQEDKTYKGFVKEGLKKLNLENKNYTSANEAESMRNYLALSAGR